MFLSLCILPLSVEFELHDLTSFGVFFVAVNVSKTTVSLTFTTIFTARVRSTREGNVLTSVCPSIHPSVCPQGGGVPISHNALQHFPECHEAAGGGGPGQVPPRGGGSGVRVPPLGGSGVRYPPGGVPGQVPPPGQDRRSTHYTAGGMPLAFTQEDFLV